MGFIRENILKIITIIVVLVITIVIVMLVFPKNMTMKVKTYTQMEEKLKQSAKKYAEKNVKILPKENEQSKVNLDTLVNSDYIKELSAIEDENVKCNGYVSIVNKNEKEVYIPYIKCGKYYETKSISDYIKTNHQIVTSDDGLYKFGEKYVFRGENPNNYILIGEKLYRILEINEEGELKLISTKRSDDSVVWDDRYNVDRKKNDGINDYSKSRLRDSLNELYKSEFFSETEKNLIVNHSVCVGKRALNDLSIDGVSDCSIKYENQNVGMIQVNEYMRASIDPNCTNTNTKACSNYNYLESINSTFRTMNAVLDNTYQVYYIDDGILNVTRASSQFYVYPVIYIDKLSLYSSGKGTLEEPYTIR